MPTLMARGVSPAIVTRVRQYARTRPEVTTSQAIADLLVVALDHLDARQRGAAAVNSRMTPEQRSARARAAVAAREAKRQHQP